MTDKKAKHYAIMAFLVWLILLTAALIDEAQAHGHSHGDTYITNNYPTTNTTSVSGLNLSLSDQDMNEIISSTLAGGSHQFDWVTTRWQLSITGATNTSDWDEDASFSFAIGKRFGKNSKIPNALWHLGYTPDIFNDDDYIHGGATILLGGAN